MKIFQIGMDEVLKMQADGLEQSYENFKEKFKEKKTTDDCYTPENVYEAVADWVQKEYGRNRDGFVRPFWPGGDYKEFSYTEGGTVVDNPTFSILAEIVRWYCEKDIKFFLFAPALTLFSAQNADVSYLAAGCCITYENGAEVLTSFITNLDDCRVRTCPDLYKAVEEANKQNVRADKKKHPKYDYPDEVITAAIVQRMTQRGIYWKVKKNECIKVNALDDQKQYKKTIFGTGFLISEQAAAERAEAERRAKGQLSQTQRWKLSEREKGIIATLK